ncbi:MAG: IS982 family transposase [Spirochaetia bacterium]|nr:IS982 family transposase [Spirochaetia bacterium]
MDESTLITVYCIVDEFINMVTRLPVGKEIRKRRAGKRGPKARLAPAEVITLNILRFHLKVHDLKNLHLLAQNMYKSYFPSLPDYGNFLKAANKSFPAILVFTQYLLFRGRQNNKRQTFFMDSTPLSVCDNHYINTRKAAEDYASRGKTTKGWFYGFKLHGACDKYGTLVNPVFPAGSVHDSRMASDTADPLAGLFVCGAGYILKEEVFKSLYEKHRHILNATRKNMKRVMTTEQGRLFRMRNRFETAWGVLKERFEPVYHLGRSMDGLFRHHFYSIASYLIFPHLK